MSKKLDEEVFICIDCETTGLDAEQDRIIEVAVTKFTLKGVIEEFESLIDPECEIPQSSIEIHNITADMVKGKPLMKDVLPQIIKLVSNHVIVGHGVKFDMDVIQNAARRANIPCKIAQNQYIDTLRLARHYGESPVNSLERLRCHFNIEAEGAHRAMNDVVVNMGVFKFLAQRYHSLKEIFDVLAKPALIKIMPLGKYKGRLMKEIPLDYLIRCAKRDFDIDLLYSLRHEIKKRKKGNLFSQAANPFANL
ncbi:DNA polymerase III PolC-type [Candidatus Rubidus massiliensis]|nr:MAG: DNA polymerase III subunit epsilon [Chlamydia sp. 32-24]CDZ79520.1 DNA polymerase III PolC-type [Candidatus Rubidus massiliensis]